MSPPDMHSSAVLASSPTIPPCRLKRPRSAFFSVLLPLLLGLGAAGVHAALTVSNLAAAQPDGTTPVDITCHLAMPSFLSAAVNLQVSSDSGATWTAQATTVSGDIGAGKTIVWDAGVDWPQACITQMRLQVTADDGYKAPPDEDAEADPPAYLVKSTVLVAYPLASGQSYNVGFKLIDSKSCELAILDGNVTLIQRTIERQPVAFAYTLSPATLPVVQGVVGGSLTVTAADLSGAYLSLSDLKLAAPAPAPLAAGASETGSVLSRKRARAAAA